MDECPARGGGDHYIEWDYHEYPGLDFESQTFTNAYESDLHVYSFGENSCLNASLQGVDRGVFLTLADERWNVEQDGIVHEPPFVVALSYENYAEEYTFELSTDDDTGEEIVFAIPSDRIDVCDAVLVVSIRNAVLCAEQSDCDSCIGGEVGGCQWCASSCIPIQDECEAPVDECGLLLSEDEAAASSTDVGMIAIIVGSLVGTCAFGAYAHGRIKQNRRYQNNPAKSPNARVPGRWR